MTAHSWDTPLSGCRAVIDPKSGDVWVYGGAKNKVVDGKAAFDFNGSLRKQTIKKGIDGKWSTVEPKGEVPSSRSYGTVVLGRKGQTAYLFGGFNPELLGDLWEVSLRSPKWKRLHTGGDGAPSPRDAQVACEDAVGKGLLIFGGLTKQGITNDLWRWDYRKAKWQEQQKEGDWPAPRFTSALCVNAPRSALVIGGFDGKAQPIAEVWQLNTKKLTWKRLADLPKAVSAPAAVWNSKLKRVVVLGGSLATGEASKSVWLYDPTKDSWTAGGELMEGVAHSTAVFCKKNNAILLIGGTKSHFAGQHPEKLIQEVRIKERA